MGRVCPALRLIAAWQRLHRVPAALRLGPAFCWHRIMMVEIMASMCWLHTLYNVLEIVSRSQGCSSIDRVLAWHTRNPRFSACHCINLTWRHTPVIPALCRDGGQRIGSSKSFQPRQRKTPRNKSILANCTKITDVGTNGLILNLRK